ncbi:MAG: radical SAM protein [Proteobacteria bacterium]|nr:radical SAM protein [Pseudomonadota bacterium]
MYPLDYIEPVFRPPSEWKSLILQVTNGCSWNKCTFCDMYKDEQKRFKPKAIAEIEAELRFLVENGLPVSRIFLADGDAMSLSFRRLKEILELIQRYFPKLQRVSSYCLPRNLLNKSVEELSELRQLGLSIMYVGCESGDNEVLQLVNKGESFASSLDALQKIKQAGIKSSVMILNGLGGRKYSEQHAIASAQLMNEAQPEYLSTLVPEFPFGAQRFESGFNGDYQELTLPELFLEMRLLMENLNLQKTIFRSDHASNYLVLKGILGRDKERIMGEINAAINGNF